MPETLLSESTVLLFGRPITDITLDKGKHGGKGTLSALLAEPESRLARIYSFAYQNEIIDLASPAIFLVPVEGKPIGDAFRVETTGLAHDDGRFAGDLRYWAVDRHDLSIRLDVMTGSFGRILLDYELAEDGLQDFVRGGAELGKPAALDGGRRPRRGRRWRSDDD
ncbi:MAG TPA: hypothetical protein VM891_10030 [Amaricoccus sp.]|nr:hypothetical protein [Amaricoccus sp.]